MELNQGTIMDNLDDYKKFLDEIENEDLVENKPEPAGNRTKKVSNKNLSSSQKFALSVMFFLFIFVTGFLILLIAGKIVFLP